MRLQTRLGEATMASQSREAKGCDGQAGSYDIQAHFQGAPHGCPTHQSLIVWSYLHVKRLVSAWECSLVISSANIRPIRTKRALLTVQTLKRLVKYRHKQTAVLLTSLPMRRWQEPQLLCRGNFLQVSNDWYGYRNDCEVGYGFDCPSRDI